MTRHVQTAMIIAGEASGDLHGAHLVRALRSMAPQLSVVGIGGAAMKSAGVEILVPAETLSVVGITEVGSKLPALLEARRRVRNALKSRRPQVLILIDFPDFNLHIAGMAKIIGIPVLYYVSPQIWAWRKGRVKTIGQRVDHMAVILPFEAAFYRKHGIPVTFVGHPLLDRAPLAPAPPAVVSAAADSPIIGLLPGSRDREVQQLLPPMCTAALTIQKRFPAARVIISRAATVSTDLMNSVLGTASRRLSAIVSTDDVRTIFDQSTLVVAASGTVTLEAAIAETPMIIAYRVSPLSYWLGRMLVRVPFIGLVNLIAGEAVVPELIQDDVTGEAMASAALALLTNPRAMATMKRRLSDTRRQLGQPGASRRVARIALNMMGRQADERTPASAAR